MKYYIYKTNPGERWDTLASKFYGNCYNITPIIEANPHLAISSVLDAGEVVRIPIVENTDITEDLPIWKQEE